VNFNKNIIFIDDGISSGGTIIACNDIISNFKGVNVVMILGIINHTYRNKEESFKKFENITYTLFDL